MTDKDEEKNKKKETTETSAASSVASSSDDDEKTEKKTSKSGQKNKDVEVSDDDDDDDKVEEKKKKEKKAGKPLNDEQEDKDAKMDDAEKPVVKDAKPTKSKAAAKATPSISPSSSKKTIKKIADVEASPKSVTDASSKTSKTSTSTSMSKSPTTKIKDEAASAGTGGAAAAAVVPVMTELPNLVRDEEGTAIPEASNANSMYQYRDFSNVPEKELDQQPSTPPNRSSHNSNSSRGPVESSIRVQKFPVKLYAILAQKEFQDIVTWMPHGYVNTTTVFVCIVVAVVWSFIDLLTQPQTHTLLARSIDRSIYPS